MSRRKYLLNFHRRITNTLLVITKLVSTTCTEMAAMDMYAKPVLVQMWKTAKAAFNIFHLETEDGRHHVIDRVKFRNVCNVRVFSSEQADGAVSLICIL